MISVVGKPSRRFCILSNNQYLYRQYCQYQQQQQPKQQQQQRNTSSNCRYQKPCAAGRVRLDYSTIRSRITSSSSSGGGHAIQNNIVSVSANVSSANVSAKQVKQLWLTTKRQRTTIVTPTNSSAVVSCFSTSSTSSAGTASGTAADTSSPSSSASQRDDVVIDQDTATAIAQQEAYNYYRKNSSSSSSSSSSSWSAFFGNPFRFFQFFRRTKQQKQKQKQRSNEDGTILHEEAQAQQQQQQQTLLNRNVNTAWYMFAIAFGALGASYAAVPLYKVFCQTTGFGGTTQRVNIINTSTSNNNNKNNNDNNNSSTSSSSLSSTSTSLETIVKQLATAVLPAGTAAKVHTWTDTDAMERLASLRPVTGADMITIRFDTTVNDVLPWSFVPIQLDVKVVPGETALSFFRVTNHSPDKAITGVATYNVYPPKVGLYFQKIQCFCFEEQRLLPGETVDMPVFFFIDPDILKDSQVSYIKSVTLSYTFFQTDADDDDDEDKEDKEEQEQK